jgi:K+-transporting ATPase KdpF subunit
LLWRSGTCAFASASEPEGYEFGGDHQLRHPAGDVAVRRCDAAPEPLKRSEEKAMNAEYIISGLIAVLLLVYLLYALLKPEKF